jgi:hypothetical protein
MPAGWEVTLPLPLPPRARERLPRSACDAVVTVTMAYYTLCITLLSMPICRLVDRTHARYRVRFDPAPKGRLPCGGVLV